MSLEIQHLWREVISDLGSIHASWQLVVLMLAFGLAQLLHHAMRVKLVATVLANKRLAIGSVNRVLFPLSVWLLVAVGKWILPHGLHTSLLHLAMKLLLAMALVRLAVYALRYIFSPTGWLKSFERLIVWLLWAVVALHLTGYLSAIIDVLEQVQFHVGKSQVNLWLILQGLMIVVATLMVALWLSRMIENKLMRTEHISANTRVVLVKLIRIVFVAIAVLFALSAVGLDITLLSVFGGALGVGLGFGLQKIASNYVSGFIILLDKSMQIGDVVSVDKHQGVIHDMRSRYTVLAKQDGTNVIIPNETLITSAVVNHTQSQYKGRVQLSVFVSFASALDTAMQLMQKIAQSTQDVYQTPVPEVLVRSIGEHGVELQLNVWADDTKITAAQLQSALYLQICVAFKQHHISFSKPEGSKAEH